jgi:hypothetical protein
MSCYHTDMNLKKLGGCKPKPAPYRFAKSYIKDDVSGCWIWQGKSRSGNCRLYGRITVDGKIVPAHRYSWELHNQKKIPKGVFVLHKCDNPECVNPDHLFLGTHKDNMDDKVRKGRQASGESLSHPRAKGSRNGLSKLTEKQAIEIFNDPRSQRLLAKKYGVSQTVIHNIKSKKTWRHIHESIHK